MKRLYLALSLAAILSACGDDDPTGPTPVPAPEAEAHFDRFGSRLVVMTRNMYVGANVDRVIGALSGATGEDPQAALSAVLTEFMATDLPTRLGALAAEIARERPHVVGLQEVSTLNVNLPAEFGFPPVAADFLTGLTQALALRGLSYRTVSNLNFQFSLLGGGIAIGDRDVLLVSSRFPIVDQAHGTFSCPPLCIPVPELGTLSRGWVRATIKVGRERVTFVSTHPESGDLPPISALRAGQMQELVGTLTSKGATVLMGDLNDIPRSPMYAVLAKAGFVDVWPEAGAGPGYTCCHVTNLQSGALTKRIDYVMVRGEWLNRHGRLVPGVRASVIGESPRERVKGSAGWIWPSDHGGVVVSLPLPLAR